MHNYSYNEIKYITSILNCVKPYLRINSLIFLFHCLSVYFSPTSIFATNKHDLF